MNKKAQVQAIIPAIIAIMFLIILAPVLQELFNSVGCQREKGQITDLQEKLNDCNSLLAVERQRLQNIESGLGDCKENLNKCQEDLNNCRQQYQELNDTCQKKDQPLTQFYFIKIFSNKIILFEHLILYHIHIIGLFLSIGITFAIKLFDVDVHIKLLNKKNQRKIVKAFKDWLADHPYAPVVIMIVAILVTNLPQLLSLL